VNTVSALGRAGVRAIDFMLRRHYRVFIYDADPACILRLSPAACNRDLTLGDGTRVARGDALLILHLWNERLPLPPRDGVTLAWGIEFARRARQSLRALAAYLEREPRWDSIRALRGEFGFVELSQFAELRRLVERLGFDFVSSVAPGWRFWTYAFWANLYSWWLMWTFNPTSLRGKHFAEMARGELWMSRAGLMKKYGEGYDEG